MSRIRFNIASLLVVVLVLGVGFAALRESNDLWDSGLFTLTLVVLLVSILLAVHRTEARRGFWVGFALFGSGYLALSLVPSIESRLMTTKGLAYLDSKVPRGSLNIATVRHSVSWSYAPSNQVQTLATNAVGNEFTVIGQGGVWLYDRTTGTLLNGWIGTSENFIRIGHSLFALLAGWLGGLLSRRLWRASRTGNGVGTGNGVAASSAASSRQGAVAAVNTSCVPVSPASLFPLFPSLR
jgi:hypothetical protein